MSVTTGGNPQASTRVTEEEIRALVETGQAQGILEPKEREMISSIFELGDKEVREVMIPRTDIVELDVTARQLNMRVSEEELARRRAVWRPKDGIYPRGYGKLFLQHIKQADEGCDFDFLEGTAPIPEPAIH